ncbi:MAG: hypothetical protein ACI4XJ_04405 [Eubacteriales bacterium]
MKNRLVSALLVLLIVSSALISCGKTETVAEGEEKIPAQSESTAEPETEAETERIYPEYTDTFDGADFNILYYDAVAACGWGNSIPCDIAVEELTGDALSDAVYYRNAAMEERYNIKFRIESITDSSQCTPIQKQVTSGTAEYDACFPAWNSLYSMVVNSYLTDLEPIFDFSMPWYDAKAREAFSILGKSYATISDLTYMDKMLSIVILYNKQMAEDYALGDLYQTVLDGNWTFDLMVEMCQKVSSDLNGDGQMTKEDRFGIINQNDGVYQLYQSAGQQFCTLNEEGIPQLSIESEQAVSVFQLVYDFLGNTDIFFNRQTQGVDTIGVCNMFANNQALFIMRQIQAAFELRNMEADFGIIPTPKVVEGQQDYYTSIGYTVTLSEAIPLVVKDLRMSAVVLDTMAAESYYSVNEALYEKILGGKIVRDETSRKNLDIILDNRVYDPGCVYNFGNITNIMMEWQRGSDQVASVIASTKKAINKSIDKFVETLRNN